MTHVDRFGPNGQNTSHDWGVPRRTVLRLLMTIAPGLVVRKLVGAEAFGWAGGCESIAANSCLDPSTAVERVVTFLAREQDRWALRGPVVYDDYDSGAAVFFPAKIGPTEQLSSLKDLQFDSACTDSPAVGDSCLCVTFKHDSTRPESFGGLVFLYPEANFGQGKQRGGRDLTGATRLSFLARGETGKEIVEFYIGGVNRTPPYEDPKKPYQDSLEQVRIPGTRKQLKTSWTEYVIDIPPGLSRRAVICGFGFTVSSAFNPKGCKFWLDQVMYDHVSSDVPQFTRSYVTSGAYLKPGAAPPAMDKCRPSASPAPALDACAGRSAPSTKTRSFVPSDERYVRNQCYVYDNVLCLMVWLTLAAQGNKEASQRARRIADALVWARENDRFYKDRWRNSYSCGPLDDPCGPLDNEWPKTSARLPGWYDKDSVDQANPGIRGKWFEDYYAVSSDVGNAAWSILGLTAAHRALAAGKADSRYLRTALHAGCWIEQNFRVGDSLGGYTGGFEGHEPSPEKLTWRAVEHNLDLTVAFTQLAQLSNDPVWIDRALHARRFVLSMWAPRCPKNSAGGHFWTGTRNLKGDVNFDAIPSDPQTWGVLALGHDESFRKKVGWTDLSSVPICIEWVEEHCCSRIEYGGRRVGGYKFSDVGDGIWPEGMAHLACVYNYLGKQDQARRLLGELLCANQVAEDFTHTKLDLKSTGGIHAACAFPAFTGIVKIVFNDKHDCQVGPWSYLPLPHIGASAFFLLAALKVNPFWLGQSPVTPEDLRRQLTGMKGITVCA